MPHTETQGTLNFDWTHTVHSRERNSYGQEFLNKSRKRLGGQNKRIFEYLISGNEIDDDMARSWTPEIRHLHSRISDLRNEMNFDIKTKPHSTKDLTVYYMTTEQISFNKNLLKQLTD